MKEALTLDFCELRIYDFYAIVIVNEGVDVTYEQNKELLELSETYFKDTPFVYISIRVNSYSVDPKVYYQTARVETLKGVAVVSNRYLAKTNAQLEKMFFSKPFEIFSELDDAIEWADKLINGDKE